MLTIILVKKINSRLRIKSHIAIGILVQVEVSHKFTYSSKKFVHE